MKKINITWAAMGICLLTSCTENVKDAKRVNALPDIYPDYAGVTIPANIAPLNFAPQSDEALMIDAVVKAPNGQTLHGQGKESTYFDQKAWKEMLQAAVGDSLIVTTSIKDSKGWHTYNDFALYVSADAIDYGMTYRLIEPGYEVWSKMGIYERNLSNFEERALIENTQFQGCVNCHSTSRKNPDDMTLHVRGEHGATLLQIDGEIQAYNTATQLTAGLCVYPYWHPEGRYLAYSTNTTRQVFHTLDEKRIEVFDAASDLQIYDTKSNELLVCPQLKQDSVMETFPVFSADGRTLYFCAAKKLTGENPDLLTIRYNLCSIGFDPETGTFGTKIDTLVYAEKEGKSISFPRPSHDGRFLCFTLSDYGQFSIWHKEADLYLLDLQADSLTMLSTESKAIRNMKEVNSDKTESFHNWSMNSRWLLFSSRRDDGLFTRPYFCHVSEDGQISKPFMLPQESPKAYYRDLFMS
ncbi:MAG: hypothetical protein Q4B58_04895 [Bacteroidales bacterium]|nr:hypothetical protein [Bacteroidales bacterium]